MESGGIRVAAYSAYAECFVSKGEKRSAALKFLKLIELFYSADGYKMFSLLIQKIVIT